MSEAIFIPFDTETGGVKRESSILTAHLAVCDAEWNIIDELDLAMKPDSGDYVITPEALTINKIDLVKHDEVAITYSKAGGITRDFIWKHSKNGKIKLVPMGKNVPFDVEKFCDHVLSKKTWNQYVSYRCYDITPLIIYLKRVGKLAQDAPESLEGLAKFIGFDFVPHTAKGDNYAGIAVIKWLEGLCRTT